MSLLEDMMSRDPARVWSASCAIRTLREADELETLVSNLDEIKSKTKRLQLGGAFRPNSSHLNFAIKKLDFIKASTDCLCALYPMDDFYDPDKEAQAGNIEITETVVAGGWVEYHACRCTLCGRQYRAEERQYHYTWWAWRLL